MQIEIKRTVKKEVEEVLTMELVPYWCVRVIRVGGYAIKENGEAAQTAQKNS